MRALCSVLAAACLTAPGLAQEPTEFNYVVESDGREADREHVVVWPTSAPGTSRMQIDARNRGTREDLRATITRTGPAVDGLVLEVRRATGAVVIRAASRGGRVFISTTGEGARGGRELPGGRNVIFIDPALHSLLFPVADLATAEGARLVAVSVRTGDRVEFVARRVESGGRTTIELSGGLTGRLLVDKDGFVEELSVGGKRLVRSRT